MHHFSLLDLSPVPEGSSTAQALAQTVDLARLAEASGYHRFWLAEHHNMPGIASAATAIVIGHVAAATRTIRVGAGGIMLPNHAPLIVAEQFGTLETLYPGRIDLGVGRAPGTDMATARALRRHMAPEDSFPQDVVELIGYLDTPADAAPVRAIPGAGTQIPVWILGSSLYGAQLAAYLGLPYAFASHFAPAMLGEALDTYRTTFRPSRFLAEPYAMMAAGVCAAETDAEAQLGHLSHHVPPVAVSGRTLCDDGRGRVCRRNGCRGAGAAQLADAGLRAVAQRKSRQAAAPGGRCPRRNPARRSGRGGTGAFGGGGRVAGDGAPATDGDP